MSLRDPPRSPVPQWRPGLFLSVWPNWPWNGHNDLTCLLSSSLNPCFSPGLAPGLFLRSYRGSPLRHSRGVGVGIERRALYATDNQESELRGIKESPFSLCDSLCSGTIEASELRSDQTFRGLNHAEDSNCTGCILGDAGRCRRCRYTRKTAAASAASGRQGSDRQGSAWQISNSTARRDEGLTICVLDARKIERSGYASHFHTYAPLRRGICF